MTREAIPGTCCPCFIPPSGLALTQVILWRLMRVLLIRRTLSAMLCLACRVFMCLYAGLGCGGVGPLRSSDYVHQPAATPPAGGAGPQ